MSTTWIPLLPCLGAGLFIGAAPARARAGFFEKELGMDPAKVVEDLELDILPRGSHGSESRSGPSPYLGALGVDAALVVYNVTQAEKKETNRIGSCATGFGPNPVPSPVQKLYRTGHQYTGAWMKLDVPIVTPSDNLGRTGDHPDPLPGRVGPFPVRRADQLLHGRAPAHADTTTTGGSRRSSSTCRKGLTT